MPGDFLSSNDRTAKDGADPVGADAPYDPPGALLAAGAAQLASLIRGGQVSPLEVVDAHIRRIEAVNPALNALVADRFEAARAEARAAAGARDPGPMHGVPFTVKEMVALAGMPNSYGSVARAGQTATADAAVVRRLRAAGAIPLGVTNVPEWGMWYETHNLVYGRTNNPWDPARTPGGSSGGEGALIGAGASPFGVGSDIGGSIRMPAAFCGVFGHKPSHGLIPLTGHHPVYADGPLPWAPERNPYVVVGPLARTAADLRLLVEVMAGPDARDPNLDAGLRLEPAPPAGSWQGRRVLVLEAPDMAWVGATAPAARAAVRRAAAAFEARGAVVEEAPRDLLKRAADVWFAALQEAELAPLRTEIGCGRPISVTAELARWAVGRPRVTLAGLLFCAGESLRTVAAPWLRRMVAERHRLAARLDALLGPDGVLVLPPHPRPAPRHQAPFRRPMDFAHTAVFNALRMPATVAPVGFDEDGLPTAVQLVARRGADHLTLAAAAVVEEACGGWQPAPLAAPADAASRTRPGRPPGQHR